MMFGVYSATNPSVSINGQVSYTARDAKVLVQGYVTNNNDTNAYPTVADALNPQESERVLSTEGAKTQYLDFTDGTGNSKEDDDLSKWVIGTVNFYEDNNGVRPVVVNFKLTNLSNYPVMATLTPSEIATGANVNRDINEATQVYLAQNGGSGELAITYTVDDDSAPVNSDNLLNMEIKFEKTELKVVANSVSEINKNNGIVTMGTKEVYTDNGGTKMVDVTWKCFAYSADGTNWTKYTDGVDAGAKYAYFIYDFSEDWNNAYVNAYYCDTRDDDYEITRDVYNVEGLTSVSLADYYYSNARSLMQNVATGLKIDTNSDLYNAIKGRSMADLYKNSVSVGSSYKDAVAPSVAGTDMNQQDDFWLISYKECVDFLDGSLGTNQYWTRSAAGDGDSNEVMCINYRSSSHYVWNGFALLPCFMLELA